MRRPATTPDAETDALVAKDAVIAALSQQVAALQHQLDWFKRQLFGSKSERIVPPDPQQLHLGAVLPPPAAPTIRSPLTGCRAHPAMDLALSQRFQSFAFSRLACRQRDKSTP